MFAGNCRARYIYVGQGMYSLRFLHKNENGKIGMKQVRLWPFFMCLSTRNRIASLTCTTASTFLCKPWSSHKHYKKYITTFIGLMLSHIVLYFHVVLLCTT